MSDTTMTAALDIECDVHTEDAKAYARTIHRGTSPRERRVLAAVLESMPCSVSAAARHAEVSRRTARRACDALVSDGTGLLEESDAGLRIDPEAIAGVEAWADIYGPRSGVAEWWEDPRPVVMLSRDGYPQDVDPDPWPDDIFPEVEPDPGNLLALRAVESRRTRMGQGTFVPFAVLDYVTATRSLQAAKVALECGRRANRQGVAEFGRGELAKVTGMTSQQVTNGLSVMREDDIATEATTTRVLLNLTRR